MRDVTSFLSHFMNKKRHHFVPQAYLKYFCDEEGKIRVYLKDNPSKIIHQSPDKTAFHRYYYSQPLPEGGKDHNSLEDLFSQHEAKWSSIIEQLRQRENINDSLEGLFAFMALQRVRVPACRDATENMLAEKVKLTAKRQNASGKLHLKPKGFEDILNHIEVPIDPHQSILDMGKKVKGIGQVFNQIGIGAIHNMTGIPFLTSDNPVIWFDPSIPEDEMKPYVLQVGGPIVLFFPVTPNIMIYGHSSMRENFACYGFGDGELSDPSKVEIINRQIVRFTYKAVFSQTTDHEDLIHKYSEESPVLRTKTITVKMEEYLFFQSVFGKREVKPKWVEREVKHKGVD